MNCLLFLISRHDMARVRGRGRVRENRKTNGMAKKIAPHGKVESWRGGGCGKVIGEKEKEKREGRHRQWAGRKSILRRS